MSQPPKHRQFAAERHAAEHVCDHVLTRPEAHDWSLVLPGYRACVDPGNDGALRRVAASFFTATPSPSAVRLKDLYVQAILDNIHDAITLGSWWSEARGKYVQYHGIGLDGIYAIWDRTTIMTGYLRHSAMYPPATPPPPREKEPLPRRNPGQLRPPRANASLEARHALFRSNFELVSNEYAAAYHDQRVVEAGGKALVERPVRITKWKNLLLGRRAGAST